MLSGWSRSCATGATARADSTSTASDCAPVTLEVYRKRTGATGSVGLDRRGSLSIQPFEGSRFVRGGRYGISIDFGLEVVEKKNICGASFKSKFIESNHEAQARSRHGNARQTILQDSGRWCSIRMHVSNLRCCLLRARDSVRRRSGFVQTCKQEEIPR